MSTQAYKCVNKIGNVYFSQYGHKYEMGKTITSSDEWGFCCLPELSQAQALLQDYIEDAAECEQPAPWNTIVKIDVDQQRENWSPYKNTLTVLDFTIMEEC